MIILCVQNLDIFDKHLNVGQLYSFSFETGSKNGLINELITERVYGIYQDNEDLKTLNEAKKLLEKKRSPDIQFIVQGKQFSAHKDVLSIRSSYFANMFSSGMQESFQTNLTLTDISSKAFGALLKYLYQGTIPPDEGIVKELIVYSEKILFHRLKAHCEKALMKHLNEENVIELYQLSKLSAAENLKEAAFEFLGKNMGYFADQLAAFSAQQLEERNWEGFIDE